MGVERDINQRLPLQPILPTGGALAEIPDTRGIARTIQPFQVNGSGEVALPSDPVHDAPGQDTDTPTDEDSGALKFLQALNHVRVTRRVRHNDIIGALAEGKEVQTPPDAQVRLRVTLRGNDQTPSQPTDLQRIRLSNRHYLQSGLGGNVHLSHPDLRDAMQRARGGDTDIAEALREHRELIERALAQAFLLQEPGVAEELRKRGLDPDSVTRIDLTRVTGRVSPDERAMLRGDNGSREEALTDADDRRIAQQAEREASIPRPASVHHGGGYYYGADGGGGGSRRVALDRGDGRIIDREPLMNLIGGSTPKIEQ